MGSRSIRHGVVHLLVLAGVTPAAIQVTTPRWGWPLQPQPQVSQRFDGPAAPWAPGHRGVDLAAIPGTPVLAPDAGVVVFSGTVVDRQVITIEHPGGLRSSFEPVSQGLPVGSRVAARERVAVMGAGGHCTTRCIHWGVRRGSTYVDPLTLVSNRYAVLLPMGS